MSRIVMVISSYGFGHLTRQIALKNELLSLDPEISITMVLSDRQLEVFSDAILDNDRVSVESIPITPQVAMDTWNTIDKESTGESFLRFWEWETQIRDDRAWERILYGADLIINDIECVHNPIASKMGIPIVNISNFTWSDILEGLGFDDIANNFSSWEQLASTDLQLPFATGCMGFSSPTPTGILCREIDPDKVVDIRGQTDRSIVLLNHTHTSSPANIENLGKALVEENFTLMIPEKYLSLFDDVVDFDPIVISKKVVDTHNYYAAADIVVSKVGYGTISEVITGGTVLLFWQREGYIEDVPLARGITSRSMGERLDEDITPEELVSLCKKWEEVDFEPEDNDNTAIAELVLDLLENE